MDIMFRAIANGGALNGADQIVNMDDGNGWPRLPTTNVVGWQELLLCGFCTYPWVHWIVSLIGSA